MAYFWTCVLVYLEFCCKVCIGHSADIYAQPSENPLYYSINSQKPENKPSDTALVLNPLYPSDKHIRDSLDEFGVWVWGVCASLVTSYDAISLICLKSLSGNMIKGYVLIIYAQTLKAF